MNISNKKLLLAGLLCVGMALVGGAFLLSMESTGPAAPGEKSLRVSQFDFDKFERLASQGDTGALYELGMYYLGGTEIPPDQIKGFELFVRAAQGGHEKARTELMQQYKAYDCSSSTASCVKIDEIPPQNIIVDWAESIAQRGTQADILEVAKMFDHGDNHKKALVWYLALAENGHEQAIRAVADIYFEGGYNQALKSDKDAAKWYEILANKGDAEAQYRLGYLYHYGHAAMQGEIKGGNLEGDYARALSWYSKAEEQGHKKAKVGIGILYYYGDSVPQDYAQAAARFQEGARDGNYIAQSYLSDMYEKGLGGLSRDLVKAYAWHAASSKNVPSWDDEKRKKDLAAKMSREQLEDSYSLAEIYIERYVDENIKPEIRAAP
jgi:TPR repeat protein